MAAKFRSNMCLYLSSVRVKDIVVYICCQTVGEGDQGAGNGRSWVSAKIGGFRRQPTGLQTKVGYFLITFNPNIHGLRTILGNHL